MCGWGGAEDTFTWTYEPLRRSPAQPGRGPAQPGQARSAQPSRCPADLPPPTRTPRLAKAKRVFVRRIADYPSCTVARCGTRVAAAARAMMAKSMRARRDASWPGQLVDAVVDIRRFVSAPAPSPTPNDTSPRSLKPQLGHRSLASLSKRTRKRRATNAGKPLLIQTPPPSISKQLIKDSFPIQTD